MFPNSALLAIRASLTKQDSFFFLSGISKLLQYKSILSSEQKHTLKHNIHHNQIGLCKWFIKALLKVSEIDSVICMLD